MKVILLKDVESVGKEGSELNVKDGFARNYLLARGLAVKAAGSSRKMLDDIKRQHVRQTEKEKQRFEALKVRLEGMSININAEVKDEEEIYGSVNEAAILQALKDDGVDIPRNSLVLDSQIKKLGVYNLPIKLHPEVTASLRVWVVKK